MKYHNKPIHIIATTTWIYLNSQLQKRTSISNPPFPKYKPKKSNMDNAIELATRKMSVGKNEWIREGKMLKLIQQKTISDFF